MGFFEEVICMLFSCFFVMLGTEIYVSGARYEGLFKNNKKYGKGNILISLWSLDYLIVKEISQFYIVLFYVLFLGIYIGADGDQYTGDWKDDEKHGKGTRKNRGKNN